MLCDDAETELNIPELGRTIHSLLHRCAAVSAVTVTRSQHLGGEMGETEAGCGAEGDTLVPSNNSPQNSILLLSQEIHRCLCGQ